MTASVYHYVITNFQCVGHELIFLNCVPYIVVVTQANFNTCSGDVYDYCSSGVIIKRELHTQANNGKPTCSLFRYLNT